MAETTFQTNPVSLQEFLKACHAGRIQLPDFQRSWVWDEDRIKSLIASISRASPVGALMTLKTGGPVNFKPWPIEGAPESVKPAQAESLLLDGQQRMTSMYQVTLRGEVVRTMTPRYKPIDRRFYLDIRKCLDLSASVALAPARTHWLPSIIMCGQAGIVVLRDEARARVLDDVTSGVAVLGSN
jgi:hypothetical protein